MNKQSEALINVAVDLLKNFKPPSDMSVNEKYAWKEGVYYSYDLIMSAALEGDSNAVHS